MPDDSTRPVVAVTGATSGIGRGVATAFARAGGRVVANGRRTQLGRRLEDELRVEGAGLTFVTGDVRDPRDCRALVDEAVQRHGRLDVVVANAGTVGPEPLRPLAEVDEAWWDLLVDTNLKGTFLVCQAAAPRLAHGGGGTLILLASGSGVTVDGDMLVYRASKAGVVHLGRCLAASLADQGTRVLTLVMGSVETEGGDNVLAARTRGMAPERAAQVRAGRAARAVTPLEVGEGIRRLVADPDAPVGPNFTLA